MPITNPVAQYLFAHPEIYPLPNRAPTDGIAQNNYIGEGKEEVALRTAFRNGTLQGAYLMIAARAIGLDVGAMSGFNNAIVDQNFFPDGRFKSPSQLRAEFEQLLAGRDPSTVVHHCGSGVSAVPNVIAMELAGFAPTGLYAGSWSEWSRQGGLPVEKG